MLDNFIAVTSKRCNRGFNLSNPLVELDGPYAICSHCGQRMTVDADTMQEALTARRLTS
jgi:hypothetical protein